MIKLGSRVGGTAVHVITGGTFGLTSACGRVVMPGQGLTLPMCRTCVRINTDAFKVDAQRRKAQRDVAMREAASSVVLGESSDLTWEYKLNSHELEMTREKVEKVNARCAKRGIPGGLHMEYREEIVKKKNAFGIEIEYVVYMTKITGIAPKLPDWDFVATLDFDRNAGLIVRTYPGVQSIDRANLREGWCDHCQTTRYRKSTYVMRHKLTGEHVQVGSACIKDFTGWTVLPYSADSMQSDVEGFADGFGGEPDVATETVLSVAWACVMEFGYVRSREAGATVDVVHDVIYPPTKITPERHAELERLSRYAAELTGKGKDLRKWILSDEFAGNSEYVLNLKAIARAEKVSPRNYGILCSAPQAWARFLEKSFIKEKENTPESNWIGEIGERWEMSLILKSVRYIETAYGSSTLHKFADASGNVLSWFASNADYGDNIGDTFRVTAGIKAHKEWHGIRETALTRVKEIGDEMGESKKIKDAPIKVRDEMNVTDLSAKGIDIHGVYVMNGEFFKIRQTKGTAYAVKFTSDGWAYSHRSINVIRATDMATAEDAARFGKTHAHCVFCIRPLTDERSLLVGYGPDCAANRGLTWGE